MNIRIAGTVNDSIVDGPGFRYTVFAQGCLLGCPGCHNPETHDVNGGKVVDTQGIIDQMEENSLLDGLTLSGGDPFLQPEACLLIARAAREMGLNVWAYSGLTYEELIALGDPRVFALVSACDVIVDGRFIIEERTLDKRFRGSKNQRLVDVKETMKAGAVVEYVL